MKKKVLFMYVLIVFLLTVSLMLSGHGHNNAYAGQNWWDKFGEPKYGGTITLRTASLDAVSFDSLVPMGGVSGYFLEFLSTRDWTVPPDKWSFKTEFIPEKYRGPMLAESWELTDPLTITFHIRKGVYWQDKPPVNGREFTAYDVQHHFDRMLGTGSGYTKPHHIFGKQILVGVERPVTKDKYTIDFKLERPSALTIYPLLEFIAGIEAPEAQKQYGSDPGNAGLAVGTGPFMLEDFSRGTSITLIKNPNYWGYDECHPQNRLPYADGLKVIAIPDMATVMAAVRSGKIDLLIDPPPIPQAQALIKSRPEMQLRWVPRRSFALDFRCDKEPFTDINVRKALQMAVDNRAIAKSHYGGTVDGQMCGVITSLHEGWCTPYEEWSQELKDSYSYNPEKAKQLLANAGYPKGFKTHVTANADADMELLQILKSYFMDIGVDMEINVMERAAYESYMMAGKHDQIIVSRSGCGDLGSPWAGGVTAWLKSGDPMNVVYNNDPEYDSLVEQMKIVPTEDELMRLCREADLRIMQQHWRVYVCPFNQPILFQPWFKGYDGEQLRNPTVQIARVARCWIDKE